MLAATSIGALGAAGGVEVGLTEANAGYLVALGGAFGLIIRLGAGVSADRRTFDPLRAVAGVVCARSGGLVPDGQWDSVAVRHRAGGGQCLRLGLAGTSAPGRCSALPQLNGRGQRVAQTGVAAGLLIGPVALGTLANTSWSLMWLVAGCAALLGAAVILVAAARMPEGGQRMSRGSGPSPVTPPTL